MSENTLDVSAELTKAIQDSLNPADMRTIVQAEIEKQTAAAADQAAADKLAADTAVQDAGAISKFERTEVIGGREFTFDASSELELERMINNAYKVAYALQPEERVAAVVAADPAITQAAAQKAAEDDAVARVDLEQKFRRGDITAADYIDQSGALKDYLAKQGVPLESLKATIEHNQEVAETQSWTDASEEFKQGAGNEWPGGAKNLAQINLLLASRPEWLNATDKVAALTQAYAEMKRTDMIFPGDEPAEVAAVEAAPAVAAVVAAPVAAAVPAVAPRVAATSSSLFGTSSGSNEGVSTIAPKGDVKIDPNASPAEIMDAWKKAQFATGRHPDDALKESYSARRV